MMHERVDVGCVSVLSGCGPDDNGSDGQCQCMTMDIVHLKMNVIATTNAKRNMLEIVFVVQYAYRVALILRLLI